MPPERRPDLLECRRLTSGSTRGVGSGMEHERFDRLSRLVGRRRSRRGALAALVGGLAAAVVTRQTTSAQRGPGASCSHSGQCSDAYGSSFVCDDNQFDYDGALNCCTYEWGGLRPQRRVLRRVLLPRWGVPLFRSAGGSRQGVRERLRLQPRADRLGLRLQQLGQRRPRLLPLCRRLVPIRRSLLRQLRLHRRGLLVVSACCRRG